MVGRKIGRVELRYKGRGYAQIVRPAEQLLGFLVGDGGGGIFADTEGGNGPTLWLTEAADSL